MKIKVPAGVPVNDKGMGIVLVLVVVSLVGAAALYLMDVSKVTQDKIATDARVLSYNQLVDEVRNKIQLESVCKSVLLDAIPGGNITGAFNPDGMSIAGGLDLKVSVNQSPLQRKTGQKIWFIEGGTSIKDIILVVDEIIRHPVRYDYAGSPSMIAAGGYILIKPGHRGTGMGLARNRNKYQIPIMLYYRKNGGQRILMDCFAPDGDAFACTSVGGAFKSDEVDTQKRCQPDRVCFPYKAGLTTNPSACVSPYKKTLIGLNAGGGDLYLCEWCNVNATSLLPEKPTGLIFYPKNRLNGETFSTPLLPSGTPY